MKEFIVFILSAGIIINLIVFAVLYKKDKKEITDKILMVIYFLLTMVCINYYSSLNDLDILRIVTFLPNEMAEWFVSPLLYLYLYFSLSKNQKPKTIVRNIIVIPTIVTILVTVPFFISLFKYSWKLPHISFLEEHSYLYVLINDVFNFIILFLGLKLIDKAKVKQKHFYSEDRLSEYKWVKHFLKSLIAVFSVDVGIQLYELFIGELNWDASYITILILVLLLIHLAYFGVYRSKVLLPNFVWKSPVSLNDSFDFGDINSQLDSVMIEYKIYTKQDLTLADLANNINTSPQKLSEYLNRKVGVTFYDYINSYRLDLFENSIGEENLSEKTIFGIAQECGFKSKATFNRLFKKKHGVTPSVFIKNHQK